MQIKKLIYSNAFSKTLLQDLPLDQINQFFFLPQSAPSFFRQVTTLHDNARNPSLNHEGLKVYPKNFMN